MGLFAYECVECGGGFKKCGRKGLERCEDADKPSHFGQFCWEDEVCCTIENTDNLSIESTEILLEYILKKKSVVVEGVYGGYGNVLVVDCPLKFIDKNVELYEKEDLSNVVVVSISCRSCFY